MTVHAPLHPPLLRLPPPPLDAPAPRGEGGACRLEGMAVDALFREHYAPLLRYLRSLSGDGDAAEDAAQEAFVQLLRRAQPPLHPRAWLFRVGARALRGSGRTDVRRRRLLEGRPDRAPMGEAPPAPDETLLAVERRKRVRAAIDALPPKQRAAVRMREEGLSHREIARALETTEGSVGTLLARALERLARRLERLLG